MSSSPDHAEQTGLTRPRAFGDYHLLAPLARGGMGAILLARRVGFRPDIQRFCVVKTIRRSLLDQKSVLKRFQDEARVVVTLSHRAICHVFDVGVVDGEPYLAMELIEGVSLRALTDALAVAGTRLRPGVALYIVDELLDALSYAHELKDPATGAPLHIVHRDVSPHNVMLSFQGAPKLIDFGLVASTLKSEQTVGGLVVGKVAYMAPEQARGEPLDARTDVYACGVILFELLTGRRFYGGLSKGAIQLHAIEGSWMPPLDDVPAALREPLRRALEPERARRTASAAHLQAELAQAGVARESSRALRELLAGALPDAQPALERLIRSMHEVAIPEPAATTQIIHIARSTPSVTPADPQALTDATPHDSAATAHTEPSLTAPFSTAAGEATRVVAPARARGRWVAPVAALASALVTLGAWVLWRAPASAEAVDAGEFAPAVVGAPVPAAAPVAIAAPVAAPVAVPGDAGADPEPEPEPEPGRRKGTTRRTPRAPPVEALPDLAAHFRYLESWCSARASTCTARVLARRSAVATLDAAGLSTLRRDAEACVLRCRR